MVPKTVLQAVDDPSLQELSSCLDIPAMESLLSGFSELTGMTAAILDLAGNVLVATGWRDACTRFHRVHPDTAKRCLESDIHLSGCSTRGDFRAYKCLNGLWDVATPIYVGDRMVGRAFIGQFFLDDDNVEIEFFAAQARRYGFAESDYLAAIEAVPRFTRERVDGLMRHLVKLVEALSQSSLDNIRLAQAVDESERAMAALRESEERFRRIIAQTSAGYFHVDREGRYRHVNKAWLDMHGYESADGVVGRHFSLAQVEDDLPAAQRIVDDLFAGGFVPDGEFSHRRRDGTIGYHTFALSRIFEAGEVVGLEGFLIDTTALRQAESQYHTLFTEMLDGCALHEIICDEQGDPIDYRFIAVNPAFERMTGLRAEDIVGQNVMTVLPSTERHWVETYGNVALTGAPASFESYHAGLDKHFQVTAFQPARGQFACIFVDITNQKRANEQILQLHRELTLHAEELEVRVEQRTAQLSEANRSLESFVYSVSHDLRAPLRAISGFADIIARRHADCLDEEARHYFDNILKASARMGDLITELLSYSRLGKGAKPLEVIALAPLFEEIVGQFRAKQLETGAKITLEPELPSVMGNKSLLWEIFSNLFDNALTYRRNDVPLRVGVNASRDGDWVVVRVSDNGIGIAPQFHEKVFDIFQRLHSQDDRPGTGIGLAVVRKASELMGGSAGVESTPGEGSQFWVRLQSPGAR